MRLYTHTHTHTHTGNLKNKKEENAITLVALVITIIILLILAGITILQLTQNGLFEKSKIAKTRTEYTSAKEIIELKLMEIQAECINKGNGYNLVEIAEGMKNADNIKIERYYDSIDDLKGIVVSANQYSKYKFLIGESCEIERVTTEKITDTLDITKFEILEEFEKNIFGESLGEIHSNKLENVYEIGQYVKYEVNGYTNWIIAGKNENGEIMLVSEGGTELYTLVGVNVNDVLSKLDEYCNKNYVDKMYATSSENYSYSNNIGKNNITDMKVLYGTREATPSNLLDEYSNGWFFNSYDKRFTYGVYSLENIAYGGSSHSYVNIGKKAFIRPIVYLRYRIEYKKGNGSKEEPYELVENSGYDISPNEKL